MISDPGFDGFPRRSEIVPNVRVAEVDAYGSSK